MEQLLIEHPFWELAGYAVILGCSVPLFVGAVIAIIRFLRERRMEGLPWWDLDN